MAPPKNSSRPNVAWERVIRFPLFSSLLWLTLSKFIFRANERGLFKGFSVGRNMISVSHLQFANDTIIFSDVEHQYINNFKILLKCFERITGLWVKMEKSKLLGLNLSDEEITSFAHSLGCEKENWPLKYLGLLLGGNPEILRICL